MRYSIAISFFTLTDPPAALTGSIPNWSWRRTALPDAVKVSPATSTCTGSVIGRVTPWSADLPRQLEVVGAPARVTAAHSLRLEGDRREARGVEHLRPAHRLLDLRRIPGGLAFGQDLERAPPRRSGPPSRRRGRPDPPSPRPRAPGPPPRGVPGEAEGARLADVDAHRARRRSRRRTCVERRPGGGAQRERRTRRPTTEGNPHRHLPPPVYRRAEAGARAGCTRLGHALESPGRCRAPSPWRPVHRTEVIWRLSPSTSCRASTGATLLAHLPHDVPVAPDRRQGDPAQAAEQDLLPDQRRRPRGGPGGGGHGAAPGLRLVLRLLPRPRADAAARR